MGPRDTPHQPARGVRSLQAGGLAASILNVLFKDALDPRGSARPSRRRLRDFATNRHK